MTPQRHVAFFARTASIQLQQFFHASIACGHPWLPCFHPHCFHPHVDKTGNGWHIIGSATGELPLRLQCPVAFFEGLMGHEPLFLWRGVQRVLALP